jgi:hypothetical protein
MGMKGDGVLYNTNLLRAACAAQDGFSLYAREN